jgi:protein involved in polysaccharide export with SLBB domain
LVLAFFHCISVGGCAALTNPVADGVPARRVPTELLEPSKDGQETISLTLLGQPQPASYRLAPGDFMGVYVEGFLGEKDQAAPLPLHVGPRFQVRDQHPLPPAAGYPVAVQADGSIQLPSAGPLVVHGLDLPQARQAIRDLYVQKKLLKEETDRVVVTLLQPRQVQVLVFRQEATSFTAPFEGPFVNSKRGAGYVVDLFGNDNDVLHALAQTGGLPGLDAYNEIIIQRHCFCDEAERTGLLRELEKQPHFKQIERPGGAVIRIPLRHRPGDPPPVRPEDVVLQSGDVVFLEARDDDLYYTGGLLPPGVFVLPRDHDLDVIEAISRVHGPLFNGAFGGSNLSGTLIAPGIGDPSPSLLVVVRRTPGGGQVSIVVDLREALHHPEERLIVRSKDVLILQEKPGEALARYFSQTFLNFNLAWQVIHDRFVTGILDVSAPDRLPSRLSTVTIVPH